MPRWVHTEGAALYSDSPPLLLCTICIWSCKTHISVASNPSTGWPSIAETSAAGAGLWWLVNLESLPLQSVSQSLLLQSVSRSLPLQSVTTVTVSQSVGHYRYSQSVTTVTVSKSLLLQSVSQSLLLQSVSHYCESHHWVLVQVLLWHLTVCSDWNCTDICLLSNLHSTCGCVSAHSMVILRRK